MKIKLSDSVMVVSFVALAATAGWLLVNDVDAKASSERTKPSPPKRPLLTFETPQSRNTERSRTKSKESISLESLLALPNEKLVVFENEADYRNFLKSAAQSNLRILGTLDRLRAARVGFDNLSDLEGLADSEQTAPNFFASLPSFPGDGQIQDSAVGFGQNALQSLGITGDNSLWGENVTVAVIDSGIVSHETIPENVIHFDLVQDDSSANELSGHGTAVASIIAGQDSFTPGVSPASQLIDVRITDTEGSSNSFLLAEGIITAVDQGADVINVSLGSYGDSSLVEQAVEYASANGAIIVASSGNEGLEQPAFPAGYEDVIAVGAIDREGTLVDFSNTGENLDLTAPGLDLPAAWTEDRVISFTGTSASAPFVTGAIATAMSEFNLTSSQAAEFVLDFTNEAGAPGDDLLYGQGTLDVGRVINSDTRGINDIAAVSNLVQTADGTSVVSVVQNQGTETITNAEVTISTPLATIPLRVASLSPGAIQTFDIPTRLPNQGDDFLITTEANLTQAFQDAEPSNNVRTTSFTAVETP